MENELERLENILVKKESKINELRNFESHFEEFAHRKLQKAILQVNNLLARHSYDQLKLFLDDPYDRTTNRYFAMVQFLFNKNDWDSFLDDTERFPSLVFIGDDLKGRIMVQERSGTRIRSKLIAQDSIMEYNDELILKHLVDFVDRVYS